MLNVELIQKLLKSKGLTQTNLADECSVSKEAVSNWLAGESIPRPSKLKLLADFLSLSIEELFIDDAEIPSPIIAYRTKQNRAPDEEALEVARDLGRNIRELIPFIRKSVLFTPPVLEAPSLEYGYIKEVTSQIRAKLNLSAKSPVSRESLLELHHEFGSILIPVLWDATKAGHENALSVYLPESKASAVLFSLNAHDDDFNYWLAHELGHCYTLHKFQGDDGEEFAEKFARELLFPEEIASDCLESIVANAKEKYTLLSKYAGMYGVSEVTVLKQSDKAATSEGKPLTGLDTPQFWSRWGSSRKLVPTIFSILFGENKMSAEEYIMRSEEIFKTPIFRALAQWQHKEGGRSPSFIATTLNIDIATASEISHALMKLQVSMSKTDSPNMVV